jgi:hypothetical protein
MLVAFFDSFLWIGAVIVERDASRFDVLAGKPLLSLFLSQVCEFLQMVVNLRATGHLLSTKSRKT